MFCEQCGTQIENGKRFCQKCSNIQKKDKIITIFAFSFVVFSIIVGSVLAYVTG